MLIRTLMAALEVAETPRAINAIAWMLEKRTGISTAALMEHKEVTGSFDTVTVSDWYQRNGYYKLASLGGYSTYSGNSITEQAALESSAVYACVKIIAEDMGTLPFFLYQRNGDRRKKAETHPLFSTLHDLVNPDVSAGEFVEALTAHAALGLDGFARIQRIGGRIYLWPWQPADVKMETDTKGRPLYLHLEDNKWKSYPKEDVFHLRNFTMDCKRSDPILQRARHSIGLTLAAQEYTGRFFSNDASPGIILERPAGAPRLGPEAVDEVKAAWKRWHGGRDKAHSPAVLQDGTIAKRLDPDHQKLQLIEVKKFQIIEACRVYRMPPHKLADLDRATFANIEHLEIEYVIHTLSPWMRRWRQAVHRCLLTVDEQAAASLYAEHEVAALLKGDFANQSEGFRKLLEKGVYSINEVRRLLNLNPTPGGDEHFIQLNMSTVQDIAAGANLPAPPMVPTGNGKPKEV